MQPCWLWRWAQQRRILLYSSNILSPLEHDICTSWMLFPCWESQGQEYNGKEQELPFTITRPCLDYSLMKESHSAIASGSLEWSAKPFSCGRAGNVSVSYCFRLPPVGPSRTMTEPPYVRNQPKGNTCIVWTHSKGSETSHRSTHEDRTTAPTDRGIREKSSPFY